MLSFLLNRKSKQMPQIHMNIICLLMLRNHMPFLRVQIKFTFCFAVSLSDVLTFRMERKYICMFGISLAILHL